MRNSRKYNAFCSGLYRMQWKIIDAAMNGKRDQLVVMATGYGKSLCYQFTSVFTNKVTVVISPLLSLMEDQVLSLMYVFVYYLVSTLLVCLYY